MNGKARALPNERLVVEHRLDVDDAHAHLYRVTVQVPRPAARQRLSLPVWIPGSYLVREFARQLQELQATQGGQPVPLVQIDKTTWEAQCDGPGPLEVRYRVQAFDTSVRTAFLDARRGFFNGSSVFLCAEGYESSPQRLRIGTLPKGWEVATSMAPAAGRRSFLCHDYAELIDHPVELGRFWRGRFEVRGVPHELVVTGALPGFDGDRLLEDTRRICETQMRFWHGRGVPPHDRYVFLLNAVEDGYGGLEHRASTALLCARRDLPRLGVAEVGDGYVTLLGLVSHEYFHTWNVKRLRPAEFRTLDLGRENYTRLLWFFEGFTSYYDDLLLLRAGRIDVARYLKLLAKPVNQVRGTPGRQVQSVAEASFDAWVKYYRPDENTPNATVSYYTKGSLVALALDLTLRKAGGSLDDAMRALWRSSRGGPVDEAAIADALAAEAGRSLAPEFEAWVHGRDELPIAPLLAEFGVRTAAEPANLAASLGLRLSEGPVTGVQVKHVLRGSAAERAGVSPGDELIAVDGWRIRRLEEARKWIAPGGGFELLLIRDQRVTTLAVPAAATAASMPAISTVALSLESDPGRAALALRRAWLGG